MAALTEEQCLARAKAYEEAANHLEAGWTDNNTEHNEGLIIARSMLDASNHWTKMANARKNRNIARSVASL